MKNFFYRVFDGETIADIANKFCLPVTLLIKQNNLNKQVEEGDLIYIEIPKNKPVYKVKATDTMFSVAEKFNITSQKIMQENCLEYLFYGLYIYV